MLPLMHVHYIQRIADAPRIAFFTEVKKVESLMSAGLSANRREAQEKGRD